MAGKTEKLTPLQSRAVDAAVKDSLRQELAAGRNFNSDSLQDFIAEKTKAITGTDSPGLYKHSHAQAVNDATTRFIEQEVEKHQKPPFFGGRVMPLPTVPLEPMEDKGRLI